MFSPGVVHVRPELVHMTEYLPGESLENFSDRTGIPVDQLIKLNCNESPYSPIPAVLKALSQQTNYNQYPDTSATALRQALSTYTRLDSRFIVLSHGSNELLNLLWHIFLSPGDSIICSPPTFSLYGVLTTFCGATVLEAPRLANYDVDVTGILAKLTPKTKLIVLCSPNNPTGNAIEEDDVLALLKTGRIVVIDEAYVEFSKRPGGFAYLIPHHPNLIILRTFSKWAGLAGLRIGYGLFPEWIARYMQRAQCPFEVNVAGHVAAIQTLNHLDSALENVHRIITERERLFHTLNKQTFLEPVPSEGNFILVRITEDGLIEHLRAVVESQGILLRYFSLPALRNFMRVTVGIAEHTDRLADALEQVSHVG